MDQGLHAISDELYHAIFELITVAYLNNSANDTVIDIINNKGI